MAVRGRASLALTAHVAVTVAVNDSRSATCGHSLLGPAHADAVSDHRSADRSQRIYRPPGLAARTVWKQVRPVIRMASNPPKRCQTSIVLRISRSPRPRGWFWQRFHSPARKGALAAVWALPIVPASAGVGGRWCSWLPRAVAVLGCWYRSGAVSLVSREDYAVPASPTFRFAVRRARRDRRARERPWSCAR